MNTLLANHPSTLPFYLNGTPISLSNPNPHWTLLDFIRSQHGLKGTKLGCGEGGCGACTVVLQTRDARTRKIRHLAVNACLYPLVGGTYPLNLLSYSFFCHTQLCPMEAIKKALANTQKSGRKTRYHHRRPGKRRQSAPTPRETRQTAWLTVCLAIIGFCYCISAGKI